MSNSFNKKYFNTILSITRWVIKACVVGLIILVGVLVVGAVVVSFLSIDLFNYNLDNLQNIDIQYLNAFISINPSIFTGVINVKWEIVSGFLIALMNVSFLLFVFIMLKKVIIDVTNKAPFSKDNIKRFFKIGIAFVIAAIVFPIFEGLFFSEILDLLSLDNSGSNYMINTSQLFMGFLVLVLAGIFEYGSNLQEDHDMTV